jgi:hypothetical protein
LQDKFPGGDAQFESIRAIDLCDKQLTHLLFPLTKILASPGVLVLIEPSLFVRNDKDTESDEAFRKQRFSEDVIYQDVVKTVRTVLIPQYFGFTPLARKQPYFALSNIESTAKKLGCELKNVVSRVYDSSEGWKRLIFGEFAMTMRDFKMQEIESMTKEPGQLNRFYKAFAELLDDRLTSKTSSVKFCMYLIFVTRGC